MKRSKRTPKPQSRKKFNPAPASSPGTNRRGALRRMAKMALGVVVIGGGGGLLLTQAVKADIHEHDLTRIGQGIPMVVQVHDPQCQTCVALQKQARKAMRAFDDGELQYLVASLDKAEGRDLALQHGVGKTTLLLFDAKGVRRDVLHGPTDHSVLEQRFRRHVTGSS